MIGDVARSEAPLRFISGVTHFLVLKDKSGNNVFAFVSEKKNTVHLQCREGGGENIVVCTF